MSVRVKSTETSATCHTQLTHHINLHTPLPCVICVRVEYV